MIDDSICTLRFDTNEAEKFFNHKLAYTIGPVDLKELIDEKKVVVIDVRDKEDFDLGHIPIAISIPFQELEKKLQELSKEKLNVIYCYNQQCHLALKACRLLVQRGYPSIELEGGFRTWIEDYRFA